jgi:hypothetical protein
MAKKKPTKPAKDVKRSETEREMYDRFKREFTAADLQKYTEPEDGIPARQVLAEMEVIHKQLLRKRRQA